MPLSSKVSADQKFRRTVIKIDHEEMVIELEEMFDHGEM